MKNYQKKSVAQDARVELHDSLALTGAEVSINHLPAVPESLLFIHINRMKKFTASFRGRALSLLMAKR